MVNHPNRSKTAAALSARVADLKSKYRSIKKYNRWYGDLDYSLLFLDKNDCVVAEINCQHGIAIGEFHTN